MAFKGSLDELQKKLLLNQIGLTPYMSETEESVYLLTFIDEKLNLSETNQNTSPVENSFEQENSSTRGEF